MNTENNTLVADNSDNSYELSPSSSTFEDVDMSWGFDQLMGIMPTNSNKNHKRVNNAKGKRKAQRKARRVNR